MKNLQKTATVFFPVLFLALLVPVPAQCAAPTGKGEAAAQAVNLFTLDLYGHLRKKEGNLVFSPYSVSICLTMAYSGARGRTESQMAKALHASLQQPEMNEAFAALNAQILAAGQGKTAEINVANALWADKSYPILQGFAESMRINYQSGLRELDIREAPDTARNTINGWVEEQTKDKIKDLLPPGMITPYTRLVLTNAIYFKGKWKAEFKAGRTKEDSFTLIDGKEARVDMMHQLGSYGYAEEPELQVLEMPYKTDELSMVVLLPSKQKHFKAFEQSLTPDKLNQWMGNLATRTVDVFLPRFKITSASQLKTTLTILGMTDAFSQAYADFSGITGNKDLFISECVHKAFVEVKEEGTEAAAATAILQAPTAAPTKERDQIPVFRADHPFLFLIRHKASNCILFVGRVMKP